MSRRSSSVKGLPFYLRERGTRAERRARLLARPCPSCGAQAGHSCLSAQGKGVRPHADRPRSL